MFRRNYSFLLKSGPLVAMNLLLGILPLFADSVNTKERTTNKLADGVYEIRHPDAPDGFPQGNTIVIIGDKGAFVVDSCLLPSSAGQDIDQIRRWTDKPVLYLLNTHWHFDHTLGNATYAAAFPNLQIVAQSATRKTIAEFNQGAVDRYPKRRERFQKMLDSGKDEDGRPLDGATIRDLRKSIAGLDPVIAEFKDARQLPPNVSFDNELNIDVGHREILIRFLGRGNTAGDAVVYLPKDKIVVSGDLLDHPVPYFFGGFPVEQMQALRTLRGIDAQIIVPGHGDVLHDKTYIDQEINQGKRLAEVQDSVLKAVAVDELKQQFAGNDQENRDFFDETFAGLVKAAFDEMIMR
jgi:cyclase